MTDPRKLYQSMLHETGAENMGGFQNRILFYPNNIVSKTPLLVANPTTPEDLATAEGTYEFKEDTGTPIAIYATDKTVGMKAENQGELDGQSFKITIEFFHPGTKTVISAMSRLLNNCPGTLVLITPEGEQFILGQPGLPIYLKPSFDGGTARADRRGTSFTGECDSYVPYIKLKTPIDFDQYFNPVTEP